MLAFVPPSLPPDQPLSLTEGAQTALDRAMHSLGRLDGATTTMPDVDLLLYTFVRKEAVLSSQIEGTQSTLDELLVHEVQAVPGALGDDVREVSRYVDAMNHGLERIAGGFPLTNRLLREMHGILLAEGRGAQKQPGEFRRSQNWIGGSRPGNAAFVPPPPTHLEGCLANLEQYLHHPTNPVVKAALAHLQFETIHPFLDGNGRVGRLLITLLFCHDKVLHKPLLYPSLYFKQHRQQYYDELNAVRSSGDYERWIDFFSEAIRHMCGGRNRNRQTRNASISRRSSATARHSANCWLAAHATGSTSGETCHYCGDTESGDRASPRRLLIHCSENSSRSG